MSDPEYLPQLASLARTPPGGDRWLHEIKLDGYRLGCLVSAGRVRLTTRSGQDWTARVPEIAEAVRALALGDALIDGELVVLRPDGRTSFEALQQALGRRPPRPGLAYVAFDLLRLEGERLDRLPLEQRKHRLLELIGSAQSGRLRYMDHVVGRGAEFFAEVCRLGLEGIVSKRRDLPAHTGRRDTWRKTKCRQRGEFVIGGFTDQAGTPAGLGALLVGRRVDGRLEFCGRVGTGFSQSVARELRRRLETIARATCPFEPRPAAAIAKTAHWVTPSLTCQATYSEITDAGMLRHPVFQGLVAGPARRTRGAT